MKARVKGTTAIIDVTFDKAALNEGYPPYKAGGGIFYYPEQLVWIDNIDSVEPDYWERLKKKDFAKNVLASRNLKMGKY